MQQATKNELRKVYREKRIHLTDEQFQSLNDQLMRQAHQLDLSGLSTVHLFLPIAGNREPDTYALAAWLRRLNPDMRLVLSKTNRSTRGMQHFIWDENTVLQQQNWGIPEPDAGVAVSPKTIDALFIPLLAFDTLGNRVGYGKGFYDRFLAECRPAAVKIGLSLFEAEPFISDIDPHDIPLDQCVTPGRIWVFNKAV